jgi:hypothetical protein
MYLVRIGFMNRYGSAFHWDFECTTDDYLEACDEVVRVFCSGLTEPELEDAAHTLRIHAHPNYLPNGGDDALQR